MGKIRFREEKYWKYIEFYGNLIFDENPNEKRWIEICHFSPSRNVISMSSIQFPLDFVDKITTYFMELDK
jgi:hypothetical protein